MIKITDKNNKEIEPLFDKDGCITNIKKYNYIHYICGMCGKEVRKSSDAFRNNGYPYNPVFDYKNAEYVCRECNIKNTTKIKYGVENISQLEKTKEKKKSTMFNNYGNLFQNITNGKKTIQERYKVDNISKLGFVKEKKSEKRKQNFLNHKIPKIEQIGYTFLHPESFSKTRDEENKKNIEYLFECNSCGNVFKHNIHSTNPRCHSCYPSNVSEQEKKLVEFIKEIYQGEIEENNRTIISPYEIDVLLKGLAIEYNGIYWHSEEGGNKDRNYHIDKYNRIRKAGLTPIFIFEDEWIYKQDIVKSIIKNKLGIIDKKIYARKCIIKKVNNKEVKDFYEKNHIQGHISSSINLVLLYGDDIVSALSFSKPRFAKKYDYEITRFANLIDTSVVGGFSKLFKYFVNNFDFDKIITYSDKRFFTGDIYVNNDFLQLEDTHPNYFYFHKNDLTKNSRVKFQKHRLKNLLENFDNNLTEHENMYNNKYLRIWDCGNHKFEFTKRKI